MKNSFLKFVVFKSPTSNEELGRYVDQAWLYLIILAYIILSTSKPYSKEFASFYER